MKKILVLALALVLCAALSFTAFAEGYTILENGNAQYETAVGYVFSIRAVNDNIRGEDAVIMTNNEFCNRIGSWSIWVIAEEIDDSGIYKAIRNAEALQGSPLDITLDPGQILIAVHSSTSNPEEAAKENWKNWEDKVAFMAVASEDCFVFDGIDLENGTCTNGRMLCVSYDDAISGNIKWPEGDKPAESTPAESEPAESEPAESTPVESTPADNSEDATESKTDDESSKNDIIEDSEIVSSDVEIDGEDGLGAWLYVIIAAAVVVVGAVVVILVKKK